MRMLVAAIGFAGVCTASAAESLCIQFLGTGASDHEWKKIGSPGVRGSASTLINGKILIDAGHTVCSNLSRFNIAPSQLSDLVITHTHKDHFMPREIGKIIASRAPDAPALRIWCSPEGVSMLKKELPDLRFETHALKSGDIFKIKKLRFTTLPSNHLIITRSKEETFWYLIETPTREFAVCSGWGMDDDSCY